LAYSASSAVEASVPQGEEFCVTALDSSSNSILRVLRALRGEFFLTSGLASQPASVSCELRRRYPLLSASPAQAGETTKEPRKGNALPLDIALPMVVLWFNEISGIRRQFRNIEKDCSAGPCFWGLGGSDGKMCVAAFLRQKTRGREQPLPLDTELKV